MRRLLVLLLLPVLLLAGCAGGDDSATPDGTGAAALADVTVTGEEGEKPSVEFEAPLTLEDAAATVVTEGDGAAVEEGQQVRAHLVTYDGATGQELESSWEQESPVGFPMDSTQINPALYEGILGAAVGSRLLIGVPPQAEGTSTALVVLDVLDARVVPTRAQGEPVTPPEGLPTVTLADDGAPTITIPDAEPPTDLVIQQLIAGEGPLVEQGQRITVQYTGVTWPGGEVFDSTWENGRTAQFAIGVGQVIPGWDTGLVGQPVGSQVLLVIPPDQGYGPEGQPDAGIEGTDTLVFVVDILDAY